MSRLVQMPRGVDVPRFARTVLRPLSPKTATVAAVGIVLLLPHLGPSLTGPRVSFGYTPVARECPVQTARSDGNLLEHPSGLSTAPFGLAGRGTASMPGCSEDESDKTPA
jgi:hypothetical protein